MESRASREPRMLARFFIRLGSRVVWLIHTAASARWREFGTPLWPFQRLQTPFDNPMKSKPLKRLQISIKACVVSGLKSRCELEIKVDFGFAGND